MTGAYDDITKWMRGYGTRLVCATRGAKSNVRSPDRNCVVGGAFDSCAAHLELGHVDVQGAVETERGRQGRDDPATRESVS